VIAAFTARTVALFFLAIHLLTIGFYPFHRDELYLIVSGRHLSWPGVNHPTPTVLFAHASELLGGLSPFAQRVPDALCGFAVIVLAGACAKRLGGGRGAQLLAALAVATGPIFFFSAGVHGTNAPDQLCWALAGYIFLGLFEDRPRWALLGLVLGIGFLVKATILFCAAGLAVAVLATPLRDRLKTARPGVLVFLLFLLPTAIWQQSHGWPLFTFIASSNAAVRARTSTIAIVFDQLRLLGPTGVALTAIGVATGLQKIASQSGRATSVFFVAVLVAVLGIHGKPYYLSAGAPLVFAAGSIKAAEWLSGLHRQVARPLVFAWSLSSVAILAGTLPLLPLALQERLQIHKLNPELNQFADWNAHVAQIAGAYRQSGLNGAPVLTDSYGTASAIDLFDHGLPQAVSSGNDFFFWTAGARPEAVLALGYPPELLAKLFEEVTYVATIRGSGNHDNRFDFPRAAYACRRPKKPLAALWLAIRRFD
jgi:Dolichyl-phosphate-mannose-protein mannosyltransferase